MRETNYEVGRACDVFQFAAAEALKDDGEIFSCDVSPKREEAKDLYDSRTAQVGPRDYSFQSSL